MRNLCLVFVLFPIMAFADSNENVVSADEGDLGVNFHCIWQQKDSNSPVQFVENVGFSLLFIPDEDGELKTAKLYNDTFLSSLYSYSYDESQNWDVDEENEVISQKWRPTGSEGEGTVDGLSSLTFDFSDFQGSTTITGNDGDGVTFTENFKCSSPELDPWIEFFESFMD